MFDIIIQSHWNRNWESKRIWIDKIQTIPNPNQDLLFFVHSTFLNAPFENHPSSVAPKSHSHSCMNLWDFSIHVTACCHTNHG